MIKLLLMKWFGLTEPPCETCDILRYQLEKSEKERRELLDKLLSKDRPEPLPEKQEEFKPITPQFVPWRVRQQMLEQEDRKTAQLMHDKNKEIEDLEKELGIHPVAAEK